MQTNETKKLLIVGESLHILNPSFHKVLAEKDDKKLRAMAEKQIKAGAMALDVNTGPAKAMADLLQWAVEVIQENNDTPLFLPAITTGMEKWLQAHRGKATINAATADPARLADIMQQACDSDSSLVVLLTKPGMGSNDINEKIQIASEVLTQAERISFPLDHLYLDPIFSVRTDPVSWRLTRGVPDMEPVLETLSLVKELSGNKVKTILALANGTLGLLPENRSAMQCRLLPILAESGLDAVILNCNDKALMNEVRRLKSPKQLKQKAA
jgi:cobalamin-dependent methionine synthase I